MPPSNQINTTSVNTLRNTSPLIDRLMRIVPFEEIKETKDYEAKILVQEILLRLRKIQV